MCDNENAAKSITNHQFCEVSSPMAHNEIRIITLQSFSMSSLYHYRLSESAVATVTVGSTAGIKQYAT
jgi:hypothetical protein